MTVVKVRILLPAANQCPLLTRPSGDHVLCTRLLETFCERTDERKSSGGHEEG